MAKRKHVTAHQKALRAMEAEGRRQCLLLYGSTALAMYRHWGHKKTAICRLFEITEKIWNECARDNLHSMIQICEEETGIEIQNGEGKSWHDLPYLNATLDTARMSNAQWVYMRHQQKKWIAPQVMACVLVALHRKYGFGFERCSRIYQQVSEIEDEFNMDPERVRKACIEEVKVDIADAVLRPGRTEEKTA